MALRLPSFGCSLLLSHKSTLSQRTKEHAGKRTGTGQEFSAVRTGFGSRMEGWRQPDNISCDAVLALHFTACQCGPLNAKNEVLGLLGLPYCIQFFVSIVCLSVCLSLNLIHANNCLSFALFSFLLRSLTPTARVQGPVYLNL